MNTFDLIDPEIRPLFDLFPPAEFSATTLAAMRQMLGVPRPDLPAPAMLPRHASAAAYGGAPDVPLLVFDPAARRERAAILHMHGGGMVVGTAGMSTLANAGLATRLGMLVVSVDYRLAPECPFPGPQEDCYAALAWLVRNAEKLGIDAGRIAVMGESAGGGLAAALAQMVRDRGELSLCGQILVYPMLDHRTGSAVCPYRNPTSGEHVWTRASNMFGWESLRGNYAVDDSRAGWFSPVRASSLAGLPPAFIATGGLDLFVDEDLAYAQRLGAAGVPVELHVYPGAIHGFNMMAKARIARQFAADLDRAIAVMLGLAAPD